MKKNLLLILMFITMFFIGSTDTYALICKKGDKNCATTEEAKDSILKEINSTYGTGRLACMYEVTMADNKTYFTYIYYYAEKNELYAGQTLKSLDGTTQPLKNNDNPWLLGSAYDNLFNNNNNYSCPKNSYLDTKNINEVCFDNNGECKNNSKILNAGTDFNKTISGSILPGEDNASALKYKDVTSSNACDKSVLPSEYSTSNSNVCKYTVQSSKGAKYLLLLYNGKSSTLLLNDYTGKRTMFDANSSVTQYEPNKNNGQIMTENTYNNKISNSIKSCPSNIYLNYIDNTSDAGFGSVTIKNNFIWDTKKDSKARSADVFKYVDCSTNLDLEESVYSSCSDLLIGTGLQEDINDVMMIIRIAVPILLIALISYDVFMSVLSGSDDKVKKNRDRIIKRVIIAIAIFFVPTLLNLMFGLVNDIWGTNFDTCGLAHFTE